MIHGNTCNNGYIHTYTSTHIDTHIIFILIGEHIIWQVRLETELDPVTTVHKCTYN
jgi:hypothetical protein